MGRPTTLPEPWRSLSEKLGGVQALANALGVRSTSTIGRYARGTITPSGPVVILLRQACSKFKVRFPMEEV